MQGNILHLSEWTKTTSGMPVELFRKGHTGKGAPLLFVGGVHGDEPEGVRLARDLLSWLKTNTSNKTRDWLLIPCLNPDGFRRNERTNGAGVDLNRNFPSKDWSPEAKGPRYHPGPKPASEPEVKALADLIVAERPSMILHFHSWEPSVVYTGSPGKAWAERIALGAGYRAQEDIGYPTPGSLGQYGWLDHGIPVLCLEAEAGMDLDRVWTLFGPGLREMLEAHS